MNLEEARKLKGEILEKMHEKNRAIEMNRSDFFDQILEASHKARVVWSQCLLVIHAAFSDAPYKTRKVTVFTAKKTQRGPNKEDVRTAAKLLRHPALGWNVRFSAKRDGSEFRIIYSHKSVIEN